MSGHEESRVSPDLPELGVPEAIFDDTVDEAQSDRVVFHLRIIKIIQQESRAFLNDDGVISPIEGRSCFKSNLVFDFRGRKEIASHKDEL